MTGYKFKFRELAEALYDSLIADPFYLTLEKTVSGSNQERREAILRYMDYSMVEGEYFGQTFIPTGYSYGVSIWLKPLSDNDEIEKKRRKKEFIVNHMGQSSWFCYDSIVEFMSTKSSSLIPTDSWYLSIVGLKPSHQSKGIGSSLINPTLATTDRKGLVTYLETFTPRNIKFYERLGYKTIKSFHEPTTKTDYWIMTRQPK